MLTDLIPEVAEDIGNGNVDETALGGESSTPKVWTNSPDSFTTVIYQDTTIIGNDTSFSNPGLRKVAWK